MSPRSPRSIRVRGRSFLATVLSPEPPVSDWFTELDQLLARSPQFFVGRALVLDVKVLQPAKSEMTELIAELHARGIRILGIEGADPSSLSLGLPPLITGGRATADVALPHGIDAPEKPKRAPKSLLIDSPVRSGQSIVFPDGDVTVVGSVASGAEVISGGCIHVYGPLRGRALAGCVGNAAARIYCHKLEAELFAIDGCYQTAEDTDERFRGRFVQISLHGDSLLVTPLG